MSSPQLILDTDILSLLMRKNAAVLAKASAYLSEHHQFTISIITRYEIFRGFESEGRIKSERVRATASDPHEKDGWHDASASSLLPPVLAGGCYSFDACDGGERGTSIAIFVYVCQE